MASLCFAVFAFFEIPFLFPGTAGSGTSIGVAAPEGLLLPSSKWPSPVAREQLVIHLYSSLLASETYLHDTCRPD